MSNYIPQYYKQGVEAFDNGLTTQDNPYLRESAPYWSWEAGYTEAWYNDYMENIDV